MRSEKSLRLLAVALVCALLATSLLSCGPTPEPTRTNSGRRDPRTDQGT
jgi:hypothetical protein